MHSFCLILHLNSQCFWNYPDTLLISHKTKGLICYFKTIINGRSFCLVLLYLIFPTAYLNFNTPDFKLILITVISYFALCDWDRRSWFRDVTYFQFAD